MPEKKKRLGFRVWGLGFRVSVEGLLGVEDGTMQVEFRVIGFGRIRCALTVWVEGDVGEASGLWIQVLGSSH